MNNSHGHPFWIVGIVVGLALASAGLYNGVQQSMPSSTRTQSDHTENIVRTVIPPFEMFYEEQNFLTAINAVKDVDAETNVRMIVVPHHLLVSHHIAELMQRASGRPINTIFMIGPNHENAGTTVLTSAHLLWDFPFGQIQTHTDLTDQFLTDFNLTHDPAPYAIEHSIGALVPFVHHYFPEAEVVPVIVSATADVHHVRNLSTWVGDHMPDDSLIIVSADFSHYLTKDEADKKDEHTKALIEERNIEHIIELHNTDYVDSPASLAFAMQYAEEQGLTTNIIHQDNSFHYEVKKLPETTSYFVMSFTE